MAFQIESALADIDISYLFAIISAYIIIRHLFIIHSTGRQDIMTQNTSKTLPEHPEHLQNTSRTPRTPPEHLHTYTLIHTHIYILSHTHTPSHINTCS